MIRRKGLTFNQELANRLSKAVDEVMPWVKDDIDYNPVFKHNVPWRVVCCRFFKTNKPLDITMAECGGSTKIKTTINFEEDYF